MEEWTRIKSEENKRIKIKHYRESFHNELLQ